MLQGFTIRGGTDTVVVVRGSGTIRDCTIGDIGRSTPVFGDAGIHCEGDGSVKHCTISMTKNVDAGIRAVGAILVDSCSVETNSTNGPAVGFDLHESDGTPELRHSSVTGPGAGLFYGVFARGTVTVADCEVNLTDNGTSGAGMLFDDGSPTMTNCTVDVAAGTGVIQAYYDNSTDLSMDNCQIDVTDGTGMRCNAGSVTGSNSVITIHSADTGIDAGYGDGALFRVSGFLVRQEHFEPQGTGVFLVDDSTSVQNVTVDGFYYGIVDGFPSPGANLVENSVVTNFDHNGIEGATAKYCIVDSSGWHPYYNATTDATDKTEDPLYCDASNGSYTLRVDSYGNPGNNGSGELIGALPVSCMFGTLARDSDYEEGGALSFPADLTVPSGKSPTLGAGTAVNVSPTDSLTGGNNAAKVELYVSGSLTLSGSSGDSVVFASNAVSPGEYDWEGISSLNDLSLSYARIQNAHRGVYIGPVGSSVSVSHCRFQENSAVDVYAVGTDSSATVSITDNVVIVGGGKGIDFEKPLGTISGNTVTGNSSTTAGIYLGASYQHASVTDNTLSGDDIGYGIQVVEGYPTLTGNTVEDWQYGMYLTGGTPKIGTGGGADPNVLTGNTRGISTYCTGPGSCPTCSGFLPVVRHNQIHDNYNGVVAERRSFVDVGTTSDHGDNDIYDNTNYCLWNRSTCGDSVGGVWVPDSLTAKGNYLGECSGGIPSICWAGHVHVDDASCSEVASVGAEIELVTVSAGPHLLGLRPNPMTGSSSIRFQLVGREGAVGIRVFDVAGRVVRTFPEQNYTQGIHEVSWNGRDDRGAAVPSGIYFIRMLTNHTDPQTLKALVLR
jgi:hypothetical protein